MEGPITKVSAGNPAGPSISAGIEARSGGKFVPLIFTDDADRKCQSSQPANEFRSAVFISAISGSEGFFPDCQLQLFPVKLEVIFSFPEC
jgi:hypothetical protein